MKIFKKILISVLILVVMIFIFIKIFQNKNNKEVDTYEEKILYKGELGNDKIELIDRAIPLKGDNRSNHQLNINIEGEKKVIDTYLVAGYHEEEIEDIFIYPSTNGDLIVVITSWNSENKALNSYGIFYEIYFYDQKLNKIDSFSNIFEADFDGKTNQGTFIYPYKTKESIINKLKELGY